MKLLAFLLLLSTISANAQKKITWPNHKKAVIVLTYDDALQTQLDTAVPQLKRAHLKATFFLSGDIDSKSILRWRILSKQGFELGNHSIYHPCSSTNDTPVHSEGYTPASMVNEIHLMNNFLFAIDGGNDRTYAYPCAETSVGGKDYADTLRKYRTVKYARIGGDTDNAIITDIKNLDPLKVPSYGLEGNSTGAQLIAFVKMVEQKGGMGIFMFHGIGGDYITTPAKAHQELLDYLVKNRKDIWVGTFKEVMDYVEGNK